MKHKLDDRGNITIQEMTEQIRKRFLELEVNIEPGEIKRRLRDLTERFKGHYLKIRVISADLLDSCHSLNSCHS